MTGQGLPLDYRSPDAAKKRSWFARHWLKIVCGAAALTAIPVILFYAILYRYSAALDQRLALADQHIALVKPMIASDPRFADVELNHFTTHQGCILVSGAVDSSEALAALQAKIIATSPPVDVNWHVIVRKAKPSDVPYSVR